MGIGLHDRRQIDKVYISPEIRQGSGFASRKQEILPGSTRYSIRIDKIRLARQNKGQTKWQRN